MPVAGTEAITAVEAGKVSSAGGDASGHAVVTAAIDGSGTAAAVDLTQPAVLDGQARWAQSPSAEHSCSLLELERSTQLTQGLRKGQ